MKTINRDDLITYLGHSATSREGNYNFHLETVFNIYPNSINNNPLLEQLFGENNVGSSITIAENLKTHMICLLGTYRENCEDMRFCVTAFEVYKKERVVSEKIYKLDHKLTKQWQKIMKEHYKDSNYKDDLVEFNHSELERIKKQHKEREIAFKL